MFWATSLNLVLGQQLHRYRFLPHLRKSVSLTELIFIVSLNNIGTWHPCLPHIWKYTTYKKVVGRTASKPFKKSFKFQLLHIKVWSEAANKKDTSQEHVKNIQHKISFARGLDILVLSFGVTSPLITSVTWLSLLFVHTSWFWIFLYIYIFFFSLSTFFFNFVLGNLVLIASGILCLCPLVSSRFAVCFSTFNGSKLALLM